MRLLTWKKEIYFLEEDLLCYQINAMFNSKENQTICFLAVFSENTTLCNLAFAIKVIVLCKEDHIVICFICHVLNEEVEVMNETMNQNPNIYCITFSYNDATHSAQNKALA